METLRQVGGSLLLAAFSAALVIGGISLALAENHSAEIHTPVVIPTQTSIILSPTPVLFTSPTNPIQPPAVCSPPPHWVLISVQPGETLVIIAQRFQTTPEELSRENCLPAADILPGSNLYVPPLTITTDTTCGPPSGWVQYVVRAGNTMFSISHAFGISVAQLQHANCMSSNQYNLRVGQTIYVPKVLITRTPLASATSTLTRVSIVFPTLTSTPTSTGTATGTSTTTLTNTPPSASPSATSTSTATATASPSATLIP